MPDDDRELMERLAALEAEVKADYDAKRAQQTKLDAERKAKLEAARLDAARQRPAPVDDDDDEPPRSRTRGDVGNALALAQRAEGMRQELARPPKAGEKSWVKAGLLSMLFGPLGWLYAGSFREAIPASAAYLALTTLLLALPFSSVLFLPMMFVALPLSGVAGAIQAVQYNRTGKRQRLWGDKDNKGKKPKLLP